MTRKRKVLDPAVLQAEARVLEEKFAREGPGPGVRPDFFWALLAREDQVSRHIVVQSLAAFANPSVEHSKRPEFLYAWSVAVKGWHVVFHFSLPAPPSWMQGEHFMEPFEDLPEYLYLERSQAKADDDVIIAYDQASGQIRTHQAAHSDFPDAAPVGDGGVWTLLERLTGLTLRDLEEAIPGGEPTVIVHTSTMIFPIQWDS